SAAARHPAYGLGKAALGTKRALQKDPGLPRIIRGFFMQHAIDVVRPWPGVLRPDVCAEYMGITKPRLFEIANTDPSFPKQIRYSKRCVGWRRVAVDAWLETMERAA